MKALELTEEHKSKLLEMCKVLFPEVNCYWEYEMYGRSLKQDFDGVLAVYHKDKEAYKQKLFDFNIHWYELCMTHLVNKILIEPNGYESVEDYIKQNGYFIFDHVVDYLYHKFKDLIEKAKELL